jgi:peptidoglycan glycosyltransferase
VNRQIQRLSVVAVLLLAALIVATTYWQAWAASDLSARQDNAIQLVVQLSIKRGLITDASGHLFAANKRFGTTAQPRYRRFYPQDTLAAQAIGYSTQSLTRAGLEDSMNDYLTGSNTNLANSLSRLIHGTATVQGDDLRLTLRLRAQRVAQQQLGNRCGAVVAMSPRSGAVYVLASSPTYDPNVLLRNYHKAVSVRGACGEGSPLLNRATAGLFTPGSTFKIVTAAAALDTGAFTPSSGFDDPGYCVEYGQKVYNAGNPDQNGPETYGHVDLIGGFQHSINSVFCNIGKQLGARTILEYAKRFGFYSVPPLETPASQRVPSGLYNPQTQHIVPIAKSGNVDPGRLAFGQATMSVTPLQMALVASAVANNGVVPRPYLVDKIIAPDGSVVRQTRPRQLQRAIKPETAAELKQMMVAVVQGGTGTAAQIPGIQVAGKTGTAETNISHVYTAWFVCFAPANDPQYAVAVVLEKQPNGFGGAVAAPIAKAVLEALLAR